MEQDDILALLREAQARVLRQCRWRSCGCGRWRWRLGPRRAGEHDGRGAGGRTTHGAPEEIASIEHVLRVSEIVGPLAGAAVVVVLRAQGLEQDEEWETLEVPGALAPLKADPAAWYREIDLELSS